MRILVCLIIFLPFLFAQCDTPKATTKAADTDTSGFTSAEKRWNISEKMATANTVDETTVALRQSTALPIEGRSPGNAELEGAWELESINGIRIAERTQLKPEVTAKVAADAEKAKKTAAEYFFEKSEDTTRRFTPKQTGDFHVPEKPSISFFGKNETFSGFTGCNRYSGRYSTSDSTHINLSQTAASTRLVCMGDYDEDAYLAALKRVTAYRTTKNQLILMDGNTDVLVYRIKD